MKQTSDDMGLMAVLRRVAAGELSPEEASALVARADMADLGEAVMDLQRLRRRGRPEAVFAEGKTAAQVVAAVRALVEAGQNALATRLNEEKLAAMVTAFGREAVESDALARCARVMVRETPAPRGLVGVLAAGTSDLPVAREAAFCAEFFGSRVECAFDVGVAGLHRLLARAPLLLEARVLVVVAGMEGTLPGVVAGLVSKPVIAVPTSVGYGSGLGGVAAFLAMVNSCSPGIAVVNIDNGFGAGYLADSINGMGD